MICSGHVSAETATRLSAHHFGLATDPLTGVQVRAEDTPEILRKGTFVAFDEDSGTLNYTFAARGIGVRRLAALLKRDDTLTARARLVSPERLHAVIGSIGARDIGRMAAYELHTTRPHLSAASLNVSRRLLPVLLLAMMTAIFAWLAPRATFLCVEILLSAIFLSGAVLKLGACFIPAPRDVPLGLEDGALPLYSLLVPLYREVRVLPQLIEALKRLDYPPEKLDIKLVIEPDDFATRNRLRRMRLPPWFEVVTAPAIGPRTKPKALNAALCFARGSYVAVFDAEDIPEPGQLRHALAAFRAAGSSTACVQARLAIGNADESWISAHFAAEYAGQFDVLLPALASLRLPILLGGTSNHFRRDILEAIGGWDPYNVTEDADLGVRLARAGWGTTVISASTDEEAPITRRAWMRQRTRWMKGWAQTLLVHGSHPVELVRDLGAGNAIALGLLTAGPFVSALLHPMCLAVLFADIISGVFLAPGSSLLGVAASALSYTNLVVGYLVAGISCSLGLHRRGRLGLAPILLSLLFYWPLISLAAWRAIIELVVRPHWWDKTEHGVSRRRRLRPAHGAGSGPDEAIRPVNPPLQRDHLRGSA
ncbi:hypothetical protein GCM10007301_54180 [Azorhizobium oxalatiphilum]|uniref:Glycosyltransferase n=1 Tax=Azorhizobium oxalatiphilum TaxID=980631 RepID=A0A917CG11_9HYPH|nr:hypothetical protein GCM10007301_54180 [Azorhizobium oxalatiphilum]